MMMDKLHCIENVIRCIKVIIVLKLIMVTSTPIPLSNLTKICCVDSGTIEITSLPENDLCTAIATYSNNNENTHNSIEILRKNLPLVYILNDLDYDKMKKKLNPKTVNQFYDYLSNLITAENINVMIFDNFHPSEIKDFNSKLQTNIEALFIEMKNRFPDVLFGLTLSHDRDIMENAFDLVKLNSIVDVFLAKTYSYHRCYHHDEQYEMAITSPIEDMRNTLIDLKSLGYYLNKMILTIRVIVNSTRFRYSSSKYDESYTSLCESNPGSERKYCKDSLPNFYHKGLLVFSYNMIGCLIQSVDRDDYKGACNCQNYPVVKSISAGIEGGPDPFLITNCINFGSIARDQI